MDKSLPTKISDVFRSIGQPTVTYVHRKDERYEEILKGAILSSGQICLITGPSKTGKTTLYKKVLAELGLQPLVVRCDKSLTPNEFWARALESIDFTRLKELQESGTLKVEGAVKLSGKLGWGWLASLIGEASLGISGEGTDAEIKERVLARPSPMHLIPVLKKLPMCLVVEDYHYLLSETKEVIFQQWKSFVDEQVSVVVLGTTHHAIDIISANRDLLTRVCQIEISRWPQADLAEIVQKGFDYLKIPIRSSVKDLIAAESVGLPILTQQGCEQLFLEKGILEYDAKTELDFTPDDVRISLRKLAKTKYGQLESYYTRLITGPRKRARTYDTYEVILSCFALQPIKFSLARYEIEERIGKLPITVRKRPPPASINSTLNALGRFQAQKNLELLEWQHLEQVLYILEPAFLFYLRWRAISRLAEGKRKLMLTYDVALKTIRSLSALTISDSVFFSLSRKTSTDWSKFALNKELLNAMKELNVPSDDDKPEDTEKASESE